MIERPAPAPLPLAPEAKWIVGVVVVALALAWAMPSAASWMHDGTVLPAATAVKGTISIIRDHAFSEPAHAFPPPWRRHMPAGPVWWATAGWALLTMTALVIGVWRRMDTAISRPTLGREVKDLRGSRPRPWARSGDLAELHVRRAEPSRFSLGSLNGNLLAADPEAHVALIAPTRSGKTTRYVIPWLLEHDGPAIVTSTKTDVLDVTRKWRGKHGRVYVWDPFGPNSVNWTPITGCEDWQYALSQAQWLADAAQDGESEIATYWRGEAARLLAPLLHAAALAEGRIGHVLSWVDTQDVGGPAKILESFEARAAVRQLTGIVGLDSRNRGTAYMSAGSLLAAYRLPSVQATAEHGLTAEAFFDGAPNTLFLVASSRQQRLLAPLAVALLSGLLNAAVEQAASHGPLSPTLRVLLDETANIAPLRDLPAHLSQAAGHGVRIATVWQSLAQARQRYGTGIDEILANSTAKLFLGPITDSTTRQHVVELLGHEPVDTASISASVASRSQTTSRHWRPMATANALQQLDRERALLIEGRHPPAVIASAPWWLSRSLRRKSDPGRLPIR